MNLASFPLNDLTCDFPDQLKLSLFIINIVNVDLIVIFKTVISSFNLCLDFILNDLCSF